MTTEKLAATRKLARAHYAVDANITRIFAITGNAAYEMLPSTPIKLLEVNPDTPPSGIMPLSFGPSQEIPFASVIVEVTPEELDRINAGALALPEGWKVGEELAKDAA